ncbi:MAG: hypothetical protein ACU833_13265 [Gammaproteobacteria bacterium]
MKKPTQIASLLFILVTAVISSTAFAGVDNCMSYWPKVPYNCVLVKVENHPSERADFSAFETGVVKVSGGTGSNKQYRLRSVPRDVARKLRSQTTEIEN